MRISDWSSDVCSSDLFSPPEQAIAARNPQQRSIARDRADNPIDERDIRAPQTNRQSQKCQWQRQRVGKPEMSTIQNSEGQKNHAKTCPTNAPRNMPLSKRESTEKSGARKKRVR